MKLVCVKNILLEAKRLQTCRYRCVFSTWEKWWRR